MGQEEAEPASHESQCCGQDGFWSWAAPPALSSPTQVGPAPRALWLLNVTSHTQWSQRWLEQHLCGLVGRDQGPVGASWGSGRVPQRREQTGFVLNHMAVSALGHTQLVRGLRCQRAYELWDPAGDGKLAGLGGLVGPGALGVGPV